MEKNTEIVVAHYCEDLEWLRPYAKNVIIYHKWHEDKPRFPVKKWIKLDNVWRESHTYLYHIVNNYNTLSDVTIFLQWWVDDHRNDWLAYWNLDEYEKETKNHRFSTRRLWILLRRKNQIKMWWKFLEALNKWDLKKSKYTFSEFYKHFFKKGQPLILPVFYAANFWVDRKNILKKDKSFYIELMELCSESSNPEEWHFMERLRFSIFNEKISFHFFWKILRNPFLWIYFRLKALMKWILKRNR